MHNTWDFAKLLVPLLFGGVFVVGFLGALIPDEQVAALVGDNSLIQINNYNFTSNAGWKFLLSRTSENGEIVWEKDIQIGDSRDPGRYNLYNLSNERFFWVA